MKRPTVKIALCEAQNWRCCYCGKRVEVVSQDRSLLATFEHIIPRVHGGSNGKDNLAIACMPCNTARGDTPLRKIRKEIFLRPLKNRAARQLQWERDLESALWATKL